MIVSWPYRTLCRNKNFFGFFFQKLIFIKFCINTYIYFYYFQDTVSVHRPGFYAHRFLDFMADKVFKKIPSRKIFLFLFILYHFISSHFFRKCKPAFQKLFYLTIVKNRESLIIKLWLLFWINKQILQWGKSIKFLSY